MKANKKQIWIHGINFLNKFTLLKWNLSLKKKELNTNYGKSKIKILTHKINILNKLKFYKST